MLLLLFVSLVSCDGRIIAYHPTSPTQPLTYHSLLQPYQNLRHTQLTPLLHNTLFTQPQYLIYNGNPTKQHFGFPQPNAYTYIISQPNALKTAITENSEFNYFNNNVNEETTNNVNSGAGLSNADQTGELNMRTIQDMSYASPTPSQKENDQLRVIPSSTIDMEGSSGPPSLLVPVVSQYREQDANGGYRFGYFGGPSSRSETRDHGGNVRGSYSVKEPNGTVRRYHYVADEQGFRITGPGIPAKSPLPIFTSKTQEVRRDEKQDTMKSEKVPIIYESKAQPYDLSTNESSDRSFKESVLLPSEHNTATPAHIDEKEIVDDHSNFESYFKRPVIDTTQQESNIDINYDETDVSTPSYPSETTITIPDMQSYF